MDNNYALTFSGQTQHQYLLRTVAFLSLLSSLFFSCKQGEKRFSIEGEIEGMPKQFVILEQLSANDVIAVIDSQQSDEKGRFTISAYAPEPGLYRLHFADNRFVLLSLEKGLVKVNSSWGAIENYTLSGSGGSESLKGFISVVRQHLRDFNTLSIVLDSLKAQGKDSLYKVAQKDIDDRKVDLTSYIERYADTTRFEPNAIFAARFLNASSEGNFLGSFAQTVERRFGATKMTRDFMDYYHKITTRPAAPTVESGRVDVGFMAPDIHSKSPDGIMVSLSSFKGKYVLVQFWASWSSQSMKENANLVNAYERFKGKNLTLLGVSLDNNREDWLHAVDSDKLAWTQVSDLKGMNADAAKMYGIQTLPFNFLVDTSGKVIARDLRGEQLSDILRQFVK